MRSRIGIVGVLVCMCANMCAQYIVEIKPTKKIIHVDQLGLSGNTGVLDVLHAMPELLDRSSSDYFANFSIQVDGKDAGSSRDVVLTQTKLAEVDVIEVSTSPTVSEQKNGEGGVINIRLKSVDREGVSGEVLLDGSTEWNLQPSVLLNYKKDKFTLRSSVMMEYLAPTRYQVMSQEGETSRRYRQDTIRNRFCQETAKLHLQWNPTAQDEVKVYMWEMCSRSKQIGDMGWTYQTRDLLLTEGAYWREDHVREHSQVEQWHLTAEAWAAYKHIYTRGGELNMEASYSYSPEQTTDQWYEYTLSDAKMLDDRGDTLQHYLLHYHQLRGEISTKHLLLPASSPHLLDLKTGANTTYSFGDEHTDKSLRNHGSQGETKRDMEMSKLYVSPYLELHYRYKGWELQAGARYQYYRLMQQTNDAPMQCKHNHTWLANANLMCQVADHHLLRLMLSRDVIWSMKSDQDGQLTTWANPYYAGELIYIFDWSNQTDYVMMNAGLRYVYAKRLSEDVGVVSANAQLIYRHGIFSMAFAGNVYAKKEIYYSSDRKDKWCFFYNVSITPVLSFRKQWTLSAKFLYNSEIMMGNATYGDCFYTQLRVAKDWKHWNIHLELDDIFDYLTTNEVRTDMGVERIDQDLYPRCVRIGASYKF